MKLTKIAIVVTLLATMLAACSSISFANLNFMSPKTTATTTPPPSVLSTSYPQAPGVATQLALGIFLLEGAPNAINKEEAVKLLPMWKMLRLLGKSDISAVEEINGTVYQIEKTMRPEQVKDIAGMQITFQKAAGVLREHGVSIGSGFGGAGGTPDPARLATRQAARQSGQNNGGGFGGGGFGGGGGNSTPGAQGFGTRRGGTGVNAALVDAVIKFLEAK